jgi:hypothetical protein
MKRISLNRKDVEGRTFYYADIGSENHGRPTFILWVSSKLVQRNEEGEFIEFPIINARIYTTEKGNHILKPTEGWNVYYLYTPCGYRGESYIEVIEPQDAEILFFENWMSPRGNLGISRGALVSTASERVIYKWKRTGRLYGSPSQGITFLYLDGKEETIEDFDSIEEFKELEE